MMTVLVRYRVREELAAVNEALIRAVFDQLRQVTPAGLQYRAYKLADDCSFVHWAQIDTADGSNPLVSHEACRHFQRGLHDRCSELPVSANLVPLDSYVASVV